MKRDLSKMTCIEDLRLVAKRKMPRMFYDYIDSGSWTETTYRDNTSDFKDIRFRQKVLVNMEGRSLETKMIGQNVKMPVAIAPTGFTGMAHADGEILAARAAEKFGIPFTLSTMSICSIEDVAENTSAPFWFQLYVMRDREFMENLIKRAKDAKCSALVLTADLQVLGQRHKDIKNGLSAPPKPTIANLINLATKPEWCMKMLNTERRTFRNIVGHAKNVGDLSSLSSWTSEQFDPRLSWDDVALDDTISAIKALPDIVSAVGSDIEVWMDSGIRSGQDVLKAWALGAKGTMIGRAFLYGLGAYGEEGVTRALEILYKEMDISMAFTGHRNIQDVDASILQSTRWPDDKF